MLAFVVLLALQHFIPSQALSSWDIHEFVNAHNNVRRSARATCGPLPRVHWDRRLATAASHWAFQCRFQPSPAGYRRVWGYHRPVGENIFFFAGPSWRSPPRSAVRAWSHAQRSFDPKLNRCPLGDNQCNHYTQLVWSSTKAIGCAIARCHHGKMVVCYYGPAGNIIGRKPYKTC